MPRLALGWFHSRNQADRRPITQTSTPGRSLPAERPTVDGGCYPAGIEGRGDPRDGHAVPSTRRALAPRVRRW
jgi:hypothetical protein